MQGTWYGYYGNSLEEITIGAHTLKNQGGTYQLHKQSKDYDAKYSESVFKQTEHILRTVSYKNPNYDFDGIGTQGWVQPTGGTDVYAPHTEAGQAVIVNYNTSGGFQALLWKSPELAKKIRILTLVILSNLEPTLTIVITMIRMINTYF